MAVKLTLQIRYLGYDKVDDTHPYEKKVRLYESTTNVGIPNSYVYLDRKVGDGEWELGVARLPTEADGTQLTVVRYPKEMWEGVTLTYRARSDEYGVLSSEVTFVVGEEVAPPFPRWLIPLGSIMAGTGLMLLSLYG